MAGFIAATITGRTTFPICWTGSRKDFSGDLRAVPLVSFRAPCGEVKNVGRDPSGTQALEERTFRREWKIFPLSRFAAAAKHRYTDIRHKQEQH